LLAQRLADLVRQVGLERGESSVEEARASGREQWLGLPGGGLDGREVAARWMRETIEQAEHMRE
jgi:hypothetical protein